MISVILYPRTSSAFLKVSTKDTKYVAVKYDDYSRKILINPKTFISSGINTSSGTITISNHALRTGQKVILNSTSPAPGFKNSGEYFIIKID